MKINKNNIIDVVIPSYIPSEKYLNLLNRALKSLENQTYKNFNTIIVINGIYCDFSDFINKIQYNSPHTIYNLGDKKSAATSRNFGIKQSKSKYVAILDADDQYKPQKLEKQLMFFEKNFDYGIVGTLAYDLNDEKETPSCFKEGEYETYEQLKIALEKENVICNGSVMFNKEIIEKYNLYYDDRYKPGSFWPHYNGLMWEDWDLWKRAIKNEVKIYNLQERLYVWSANTSVAR